MIHYSKYNTQNFITPFIFIKFERMKGASKHIKQINSSRHVIVDMSDCYTWSFPEFVPFCQKLYYFSNFKDFTTFPQA